MDVRSSLRSLLAIASLLSLAHPSNHAQTSSAMRRSTGERPNHRIAIIEGDAQAGQAFERTIGSGLKILLDPIASGWVLRVVPASGSRGSHDYAELATPPYQSVSPLLISTDFSFRAQDALAWNPRRFHFANDRAAFQEFSRAYANYQRLARIGPSAAAEMRAAELRLAALVSLAAEAELTLLDARLVQGTGDQTRAASLVALHPNSSARQVDQPTSGVATPLGRLNWVRFRIRIDLPKSFQADPTLHVVRAISF